MAAFGCITSSRTALDYRLSRGRSSHATAIVIGGAAEALNHHPSEIKLRLNSRKGFVKLALRHGADLVPVFVFGENFLYSQADNPEGSRLRRFQVWFKDRISFSPPAFYGRGFFQYTFGFLPYRRPLNLVIGAPLRVDRAEGKKPSPEAIDALHAKYVSALKSLYEEHNPTLGTPGVKLVIS